MRIFLLFLVVSSAHAQDGGVDQGSKLGVLEGLQRIFGNGPPAPASSECVNRIAALDLREISCTKLLEGYCKAAWLPGTDGNFDSGESRFRMGSSAKGGLKAVERENLDALLAARPRLRNHPDPVVRGFMSEAAPILERMEWLGSLEEDSDSWREKLSEVSEEYSSLISSYSKKLARASVSEPERDGKGKKNLKWDVAVRRKTYEAVHKIHDAITEAKWAHHPNWKRVERSFERAKQRLLEVVSGEPLPEPQKALMLERIRDVTLHLPLSDPSVFGWRKIGPCSTTKNNASYTSLTNRVTVCAGLFNSYASEATLFGVIAHELGHSVDPSGLSSGRVENGTALSLLRGVVQAGSKIECSDWTRRKGELLGKPSPVPEANPLGKLYECLVADFRTMRRPWNATVMEADAWRDSDNVISGLASNRAAFTRLTARLDAGVDDVEGLLQPDADHIHINCAHRADDAAAQYVFLQEWRCNGNPNKGVRMKEAIAGAASILRRKSMETNALCGGYCGDGPSDPTVGEYFSDWLAVRAIEKDLASLSPSQRLARAAEASVFWCENPAETRALEPEEVSERDLVRVHPYTGTRFNAFVSRKARQEIGCRMDEDESRTYAECKP